MAASDPLVRLFLPFQREPGRLAATAARGLTQFDDPAVARKLVLSYRKVYPHERPAILEALVSRPAFAREMLANIGAGKIPREDIGAYHARQIRALGDLLAHVDPDRFRAAFGAPLDAAAEVFSKNDPKDPPAVLTSENRVLSYWMSKLTEATLSPFG